MNVFNMCFEFHYFYLTIKRDITVQKIKVITLFLYCLFLLTGIDYRIIDIIR